MPIKITALGLLFNLFQLAIAAAPAEPVTATQERLAEMSSIAAQSAIESSYSKAMRITLTAYSSTPEETDDTPCITASGLDICEAQRPIVAANFLPLGTKVKIPELFGDTTFVVEDRMNKRYTDRMDIWFPDKASAKAFGLRKATILIL